MIRCKICGTINEATTVFCSSCGNFLPDNSEPYDPDAEKAAAEKDCKGRPTLSTNESTKHRSYDERTFETMNSMPEVKLLPSRMMTPMPAAATRYAKGAAGPSSRATSGGTGIVRASPGTRGGT